MVSLTSGDGKPTIPEHARQEMFFTAAILVINSRVNTGVATDSNSKGSVLFMSNRVSVLLLGVLAYWKSSTS